MKGASAWVAAAATIYFLLPGNRSSSVGGFPLGPYGSVIVAAAIVLGCALRPASVSLSTLRRLLATFAVLASLRVVVGLVSPGEVGFLARYYANERFEGAPRWSSDFRYLHGATRIDRAIAFKDDTFPAYYLNDYDFPNGIRREVTEPMSVEWVGTTTVAHATLARLSLTTRGRADVAVDGGSILSLQVGHPQSTERTIELPAGRHDFVVRYVKPSNTDGLIEFDIKGGVPPIVITADGERSDRMKAVAVVTDVVAILTLTIGVVLAVRAGLQQPLPLTWRTAVIIALFGVFAAQGWRAAVPFAGKMVALTGGDDWWGFESCARDILHHGPLMTLGRAVGEADAYFYHPLYCYFLAAVHAVTGESLFGPVFVQFLLLAAVAVVVWRLVAGLFGEAAGVAGLCALLVVFELDFARYYTVTLLSENLYIVTVTLALVPLVRWIRANRTVDLVKAAFWAGGSTITRPPMLFFLPLAAVIVVLIGVRRENVSRAFGAAAAFVVMWLAVIAPVTLRNVIVARKFVLVSDVPASSLLMYNIPPSVSSAEYGARFRGTSRSALLVLGELIRDHPSAMLGVAAKKIGFSLGMIQWAGYRPHPELLAASAAYIAAIVFVPAMRRASLLPIHFFILTHLGSMLLTLPWNYGYRMVLPPFVYTSALAAAAWASILTARFRPMAAAELRM